SSWCRWRKSRRSALSPAPRCAPRWRASTARASNGCRRAPDRRQAVGPPFAPQGFVTHFVTMTEADDPPLAAEFPPATREQWRKRGGAALKGARRDQTLGPRPYARLAVEPLYPRKADARPLASRAPGLPWAVVQRVDHPDPAAANAEALHDLENSATGL